MKTEGRGQGRGDGSDVMVIEADNDGELMIAASLMTVGNSKEEV